MPTIPENSKKFVFNKDADEPLTESEIEAWNTFEAWEASTEEKENNVNNQTLADKIDFEDSLFIKAMQLQFIIEDITKDAWEKLNEQIQLLQPPATEKTITKKKQLRRLYKWIGIAAAATGLLIFIPGVRTLLFNEKQKQPKMITITTGFGETRSYTLPDSTHIVLNALSSITCPEKFTGNERNVQLKGEAWFDVQSDKQHPFIVNALGTTVTATGTQFNVKAFEEEERVIASLRKGMITVKHGNDSVFVKEGGQATFSGNHLTTTDTANFDNILAWEHKEIVLEGETILSIMRQINRYYHLNYRIIGTLPPVNFGGRITRRNKKEEVISYLDLISDETRFHLYNDTVFIYQGAK